MKTAYAWPVLILGLFLISPCYTYAQHQIRFEPLTVDDGLSNGSVTSIVQDHQGFMWFGTLDGLNKYDGVSFTVYRHDPDDPSSLSSSYIESLAVDRSGRLWVGTYGAGLNRFDAETETFIQYRHDPDSPNSLSDNYITQLFEDSSGILWIGTLNGGLNAFNPETETFVRYRFNPDDPFSISDNNIRAIYEDGEGTLWIGTGDPWRTSPDRGGLNRFDREKDTFRRYQHDAADPNTLSENNVWAIHEDSEGTFWVGTWGDGLHTFDRDREIFTRLMYDPEQPGNLSRPRLKERIIDPNEPISSGITFIYENTGEPHGLWTGALMGGINRFDYTTGSTDHFEYHATNPYSPGSNAPWAIYEDAQGILWIGFLAGGISKVDLHSIKFPFFQHDPGNSNSVSKGQVRAIHEDQQDNLWIGTLSGLDYFNRQTGEFTHYTHDPEILGSLSNQYVSSIAVDGDASVWIGTSGGGLNRFDPETRSFTHFRHDPLDSATISSNMVWQVVTDSGGNLWIGTSAGLDRFDYTSGTFDHYESSTLLNTEITALQPGQDGSLWIGPNTGGLIRFETETSVAQTVMPDIDHITSIYEDDTGMIWVGSCNLGLHSYDPNTGSTRRYTGGEGFPSARVAGILGDEEGNIWVRTIDGISRIRVATGEIRNFSLADGVTDMDCTRTGSRKSRTGELFFGGPNGFNAFYPEQVRDDPIPPDVVLTALKVGNETVKTGTGPLERHISVMDEITLSHQQNNFTLEFAALHYSRPDENRYAYRLDGYDSEWHETGVEPVARYMNLPPDRYTFRVKAANYDGVWNEEGVVLSITILPPWWRTWWAWLIYALLLMAGVVAADRIRRRRLIESERHRAQIREARLKAETLEEVNQLKNNLYTNITHEFRTPLTVILGMADALTTGIQNKNPEKTDESLGMIQRNGKKLLRLVNEILDLTKLESGNMELQLIRSDIIPFVKYISESFQSLAEESQINLTVYSEIDELVMDFDADKLSTVLTNLLSNAIKFTPRYGKIIVHVNRILETNNEVFMVKVKDNGAGIPEEALPHIFDRFYQADSSASRRKEGTGIGLALTKELVERMGGTIGVKSVLDKGSEFTVRLPVTRDGPEKAWSAPSSGEPQQLVPVSTDFQDNGEPMPEGSNDLPVALLIEDNKDVTEYLKTCLNGKYQTLHAGDGIKGVDMACEHIPDIIICDVMMPGKDGFEVCSTLKTDERTDHIPMIILTAKATKKDRLAGLSHGADAYLTKPFSKSELFTRMDQLVLLRQKMLQKFESVGFSQLLKSRSQSPETKFIQKIIKIIHEEISSDSLNSKQLAYKLHLSESQLYRKLKAISGTSTAVFIRSVRLQKAQELILTTDRSISEIAYDTGFNDPSWFSRAYKEEFGFAPSETSK